jgi:hypothetical protein
MAPEKCTLVAAQENHVSVVTGELNDSAWTEFAQEARGGSRRHPARRWLLQSW